jgi:hypothetical protein
MLRSPLGHTAALDLVKNDFSLSLTVIEVRLINN